ncbi:hypothetical protein LTR37_006616 [Vermiconidia calcicola]|uniref:Uncharacterized protein n=1 Tax=Vermiconidia calcicola TaxID=1690605 RepID=A0ACC3NGX2_9PEZI|nr:hypothetical protein LTR37_006616 [Vermiconidia calcicola]
MPNDLFQWEAAGGLGTSSQCEPCRRSNEEHTKRHREIAEKIHELKLLKAEHTLPASPLTPRAFNTSMHLLTLNDNSPSTKKERKAAKNAKKVSEMTKVLTCTDIEFVAKVLHPNDSIDEVELERRLLHDPDINDNRFFHKGTSNRREIRNVFVKKEKRGNGKEVLRLEAEELDGILQLLNVSPITSTTSAGERTIIAELRKKIEEYYVHDQNEKELMMMRKAGFWRWASSKAHKRLVENGKIWGVKDDRKLADVATGSDSSSSQAVGGAERDAETDTTTEADTDVTTPSSEEGDAEGSSISKREHGLPTLMLATPKPKESLANMAGTNHSDGWTTIGNPNKVKKPVGNLKLVSNGGLLKLAQSPTAKRTAFYSDNFDDEA